MVRTAANNAFAATRSPAMFALICDSTSSIIKDSASMRWSIASPASASALALSSLRSRTKFANACASASAPCNAQSRSFLRLGSAIERQLSSGACFKLTETALAMQAAARASVRAPAAPAPGATWSLLTSSTNVPIRRSANDLFGMPLTPKISFKAMIAQCLTSLVVTGFVRKLACGGERGIVRGCAAHRSLIARYRRFSVRIPSRQMQLDGGSWVEAAYKNLAEREGFEPSKGF